MSSTATGPVADRMLENEWIVRGTQDPVAALAAVAGETDELWGHDTWDAEQAHMWCYGLLSRAYPGLWRKAPVGEGTELHQEGCTWQLLKATRRGPGVFAGVYFRN